MIKSIIIRRPIIMARREKQPVHKVVMTEGKRNDHQPDIRHADGYLWVRGFRGLHFGYDGQAPAADRGLAEPLTLEGKKEVFSIQIGENESSGYWLSVLNELKNRGVKDILILCSDGLTGIKEAHIGSIPEDGTAALYRAYGTQYAQICL